MKRSQTSPFFNPAGQIEIELSQGSRPVRAARDQELTPSRVIEEKLSRGICHVGGICPCIT